MSCGSRLARTATPASFRVADITKTSTSRLVRDGESPGARSFRHRSAPVTRMTSRVRRTPRQERTNSRVELENLRRPSHRWHRLRISGPRAGCDREERKAHGADRARLHPDSAARRQVRAVYRHMLEQRLRLRGSLRGGWFLRAVPEWSARTEGAGARSTRQSLRRRTRWLHGRRLDPPGG